MLPVEIESGRNNLGVDPVLHIWGWEVPVYLFLGGLVAGLFVLSAGLELWSGKTPRSSAIKLAPFGALVLISLGMGALFLDLAHKLYVWRFYLAFKPTSPMSWGAWILLLVYPLGLLQGLGATSGGFQDWLRGTGRIGAWLVDLASARRTVLWGSVVVGTGLGVYTGILLGIAPARILWNSAVLGPLFLVSGLSTGAALLLLFPLDHAERDLIARFDAGAIVVELALIGLFLLGLVGGGEPQHLAAEALLGGEYTAAFWSLVVLLGLVTPLALEGIEMKTHRTFTRLAPLLVLIGGFCLRYILVAAGQHVSFAQLL